MKIFDTSIQKGNIAADSASTMGTVSRKEKMLRAAEREYNRQGLADFFGKSFTENLLPELSQAYALAEKAEIKWSENAKANLLAALMRTAVLKDKYEENEISQKVFEDTVNDIGVWSRKLYDYSGKVGLLETYWISNHLSFRLFKLGRLQFCLDSSSFSVQEKGINEGDNVISVHIQEGAPLDFNECQKSFEQAKLFFAKHFSDFHFDYFTCHSWLMDKNIVPLFGKTSNIAKFQTLFNISCAEKSTNILKYVFRWDINPDELKNEPCKNRVQTEIKESILNGNEYFVALGIRAKNI